MIFVYTAILGEIADKLRAVPAIEGVRFVAFVTDNVEPAPGWEIQQPRPVSGLDSRRWARFHKLQPDRVLSELADEPIEASIWMDGAFSPKFSDRTGLNQLLRLTSSESPLATFQHASRCCIVQEMHECLRLRKDREDVLRKQIDTYLAMGYPYFNGLWETMAVVRRHCESQRLLDDHWWNQLEQFSCRDQVSLPFASWLTKIPIATLPGTCYENSSFSFYSHW